MSEETRSAATLRVQIGGLCIKGGGHIWTYEEGPDGCSGWPIFIELDPEDVHLFPEWVRDSYYVANDRELPDEF